MKPRSDRVVGDLEAVGSARRSRAVAEDDRVAVAFAYTSLMRRLVFVSACFTIESSGVMPLPPPNITIGRSCSSERSTNRPSGGFTAIRSPAANCSLNQFETRPRSMRFTVTFGFASIPGALESE
jgi:hypothetical protein